MMMMNLRFLNVINTFRGFFEVLFFFFERKKSQERERDRSCNLVKFLNIKDQ